jgi:hypothetical protein
MKTGFNGAVASAAAAFDGVEDEGKAVAMQRWHLTPAAAEATAGREGSSVDVGVGGGGGGWCGRRWWQLR